MKFEWDEAKNHANREKHGITLVEASKLWEGFTYEITSNHEAEPRKIAFGKIGEKHWTVIFTMRDESFRLISARRSRDNEIVIYENKKNQC